MVRLRLALALCTGFAAFALQASGALAADEGQMETWEDETASAVVGDATTLSFRTEKPKMEAVATGLQPASEGALQSVATHPWVETHPTPAPPDNSLAAGQLRADLQQMVSASGGRVGVTLIDLGGNSPQAVTISPDDRFTAASTYKLPLLMWVAEGEANGRLQGGERVCFQPEDWEEGYYEDYTFDDCLAINDLAVRVGHYSDNTAAHMLVRRMGGEDALNAYARTLGANESQFCDPNQTTSADLARLWQAEAQGRAGAAGAQAILYPWLTNTNWEEGIPAGTPRAAQVTHKVGMLDEVRNDAALIRGGPHGDYILVVMTDGLSDQGWAVQSELAARVWQYEQSRA